MHKRVLRLLAAVAIIGLAACAQTLIFPAKSEIQARPSKKVFLWNVQSPKATAYLLGSVHAARSSLYPLDERIEKAFVASDTLVVEVNTVQTSPAGLGSQMTAQASHA